MQFFSCNNMLQSITFDRRLEFVMDINGGVLRIFKRGARPKICNSLGIRNTIWCRSVSKRLIKD